MSFGTDLMPAGGPDNAVATQFQMDRAVAKVQAELQSMMMMAVKYPRDERAATEAILERCDDPDFADAAVFELERTDYRTNETKIIRGLTIDMAEEIHRQFRNILVTTELISETSEGMLLDVSVWDIERNIKNSEPVYVSKTVERSKLKGGQVPIAERRNARNQTIYIVAATDDELRSKMLGLTHRNKRNGLLCAIPSDIQDKFFNKCMETKYKEANKQAQTSEGQQKIIDSFKTVGVSQGMIEQHIKHPITELSQDEWVHLRGLYRAVTKEGLSWEQATGQEEKADPKPEAKLNPTQGREAWGFGKDAKSSDSTEKADSPEQMDQTSVPLDPPPLPKLAQAAHNAFLTQCEKLKLSQDMQNAAEQEMFVDCEVAGWTDLKTSKFAERAIRWVTETMPGWVVKQRS